MAQRVVLLIGICAILSLLAVFLTAMQRGGRKGGAFVTGHSRDWRT